MYKASRVMIQMTCAHEDCHETFVTCGYAHIRGDRADFYPIKPEPWTEVREYNGFNGWNTGYACPAHAAELRAAEVVKARKRVESLEERRKGGK